MLTPRIVVIDDDLDILDMAAMLLALQGYEPRCCLTAADALRVVQERQPAMVIVDLHLERLEAGLDVVDALHHDITTAQIPILLWSADPRVGTIAAGHHLERVVVREKPLLATELLSLVDNLAHAS